MAKVHAREYAIWCEPTDDRCLTLQAVEYWPGDTPIEEAVTLSDTKSLAEIIVNAANYAIVGCGKHPPKKPGGYHFTHMDRALWVEPRMKDFRYLDPRDPNDVGE